MFHFSSAQDTLTGNQVAIKKLSRPFQSVMHAKRAYRELRLLKHMCHENVSKDLSVYLNTLYCSSFKFLVKVKIENDFKKLFVKLFAPCHWASWFGSSTSFWKMINSIFCNAVWIFSQRFLVFNISLSVVFSSKSYIGNCLPARFLYRLIALPSGLVLRKKWSFPCRISSFFVQCRIYRRFASFPHVKSAYSCSIYTIFSS